MTPGGRRVGSGPGLETVPEARSSDVPPEIWLWSSVLQQALLDARTGFHDLLAPRPATSPVTREVILEARRWLTEPSPDLAQVLEFCRVEPAFWYEKVAPALEAKWLEADRRAVAAAVRKLLGTAETAPAKEQARRRFGRTVAQMAA